MEKVNICRFLPSIFDLRPDFPGVESFARTDQHVTSTEGRTHVEADLPVTLEPTTRTAAL